MAVMCRFTAWSTKKDLLVNPFLVEGAEQFDTHTLLSMSSGTKLQVAADLQAVQKELDRGLRG